MSTLDTPTHVGRIERGRPFLLAALIAIAASLLSCSTVVTPPARKVMFVNFDHERARAAFARFVAACEAIGIQERYDVALEFIGVDVMDEIALRKAMVKGLAGNPVAIIAPTSPVLIEAARLTATTPIVFFTHQDPVDLRLAASLTRRPQNIAGISFNLGIQSKMLELLRETAPNVRSIGYIVDADEAGSPNMKSFLESSARKHGIHWSIVTVSSRETLDRDIKAAGAVDAWFVTKASVLDEHRREFISILTATRHPAIYPSQLEVANGAPMAYEAVFDDPNGALARQLDRVLSGVTPGDIPIERPKRFRLSLNVDAARASGMLVTSTLLARADLVR
jgi:putative ABC transport system substrate-binding protein